MQIDPSLADSLMGSVSSYIGQPKAVNPSAGFTFKFFNADHTPIAELIIWSFDPLTSTGQYAFKGEGGSSQITGNVTATGKAASFEIEAHNSPGGVCFRGTVGAWADVTADIKFNDRNWSSGDILIITGLVMSIPQGSFTVLD